MCKKRPVADHALTVATDFENAFNTVDRSAVFAAVAKREPGLLPYVRWLYGTPSQLHVLGAPTDADPIYSEAGVRQGDPISPLLFALTLQDPLEHTAAHHPTADVLGLHDDVHLQDDVDGAVAATETLFAAAAQIGLRARRPKCGAYSQSAACGAAAAARLQIPQLEEGLVATGTPVGSDAFIKAHVAQKSEDARALVAKLEALPMASQVLFAVLKGSLQQRLAHLTRTCEWRLIACAVTALECAVAATAFRLAAGKDPDPAADAAAIAQLSLPVRLGGCGLHHTRHQGATAAYLAAAALAHVALTGAAAALRPFDGDRAPQLKAAWAELHDSAPGLWPDTAREADDSTVRTVLPAAQRTYGQHSAGEAREALLSRFAGEEGWQEQGRARLHGVACGHASLWLDALPTSHRLRMRNPDFRLALQLRLGISTVPANAPSVRCGCGRQLLPDDLDHAMVCDQLSKSLAMRHDLLKEEWRRWGSHAGCATSMEPHTKRLRDAQARAQRAVVDQQGRAAAAWRAPAQQGALQPPQQQAERAPQQQQGAPPVQHVQGAQQPQRQEGGQQPGEGQQPPHVQAETQARTAQQEVREREDRAEARGDVLFVLPDNMLVADVTVCHPSAPSYRRGAAGEPGHAAARREREKRRIYETGDPYGYGFTPLVTESFGRHGRAAMDHLNKLGEIAAGAGVNKRTFVRNALRDLSVALVKGNGFVFRQARNVYARVCGSHHRPGLRQPTAEGE